MPYFPTLSGEIARRGIKKKAIAETNINGINYYAVPSDDIIDVYDTYEHNSIEMEIES